MCVRACVRGCVRVCVRACVRACIQVGVFAGVLYVLCSCRCVVFVTQGMEMKNVRWDGGGNLSGSSAKLTQDEVRLCEYMTSYYISMQHSMICGPAYLLFICYNTD